MHAASVPRRAPMPAVAQYAGWAMVAWSIFLLVSVGFFRGEPWVLLVLFIGVINGALAMTGFVRRAMCGPLVTTLLLHSVVMFAAGLRVQDLSVILIGALMLVVIASAGVIILAGREGGGTGTAAGGRLEQELAALRDTVGLSDAVRRVLHRDHESSLLRAQIDRDIESGRLDEAMVICNVLADTYGQRSEAEALRERILDAQHARDVDHVRMAIEGFDALLAAGDWTAAHRDAARIVRLYGDAYPLPDLEARLHAARETKKHELERRFLEAAQRDDAEGAMVVLKELDRYLSPAEAEGLSEVARGVVGRHRENLGVRFRLALQDHRWVDAVEAGEAIMGEFPNTRMAQEVRSVIEVLRSRAVGGSALSHAPVGGV